MLYLILTIESLILSSILIANNIIMEKCKDKAVNNIQYTNWVGATILFIVALIMKMILRSGGASFSERYDIGIGTQHGPTDAEKYAVDAVIFGITIFSVVLLLLNGIRTTNCKKYDWKWLKNINWIFMAIYLIIAMYGITKMTINVRSGKSIL